MIAHPGDRPFRIRSTVLYICIEKILIKPSLLGRGHPETRPDESAETQAGRGA
jgi:hypothetical protein